MSTERITRNSQKAGIGATLRSIAQAVSDTTQGSTSTPAQQPRDFSLDPEDPLGNDSHHSDHSNHSNISHHSNQDAEHVDKPDINLVEPDQPVTLAQTLELLAKKLSGPTAQKPHSAVKPRNPDSFDGSDPNKIETFIFQVSMYISTRSADFPDDESRVAFALSYLKGTPLDWFQTEISHAMSHGGKFPSWFSSYPGFLAELQRLFGPRDPVNDAVNAIESLRYKDSTKATRYTLEFNRHSRRTGWNEQALSRHYYKGLPDRLKDEISRISKPTGLLALQDLAATLDQRHWERQNEISHEKRPTNTSNNYHPNKKQADDKTDSNHSNQNHGNPRSSGNQQPSRNRDQKRPQVASTSTQSHSNSHSGNKTNALADILGPDGKLKPEERQRRLDKNLCLRCGQFGHMVPDCPPPSKAKAKGRAATTVPAKPATAPTTATIAGSGKG